MDLAFKVVAVSSELPSGSIQSPQFRQGRTSRWISFVRSPGDLELLQRLALLRGSTSVLRESFGPAESMLGAFFIWIFEASD